MYFLFSDVFLLQFSLLCSLFFFFKNLNLLILWYLTGLILMALGFLSLLDDHDIFIGFLWLIDFGVGLIFFLFILHFSTFLFFKVSFEINFFLFFFCFSFLNLKKNYSFTFWLFCLTWYDYYAFHLITSISDLNLLKEIYFFNNSFEFIIINLVIFYGIVISISFYFLFFFFLSFFNIKSFIKNKKQVILINAQFFRQQNFLQQQGTLAGVKGIQKSTSQYDL